MQTVQFIDTLKTGVSHIDTQHESLVEMINVLIEVQDQGRSPDTVSFILAEMAKYIYVHFRDEERFMKDNQYAGLAVHRLLHESFEDKVAELKELYDEGDAEMLEEVLEYLSHWLVHHIQGDDAEMVMEIKAQKEELNLFWDM